MRFAAVLLIFFCFSGSSADGAEIQKSIADRRDSSKRCDRFVAQLSKLKPSAKLSWDRVSFSRDEIEQAERILSEVNTDEPNATRLIPSLETDFEKSYRYFYDAMVSNCSSGRLNLSRGLIATYSKPNITKEERARVREILKESLEKEKFPLLINAGIDSAILGEAVHAGIWEISDTEKDKVTNLQREVRQIISKVSGALPKEFEKSFLQFGNLAKGDQESFLKSSAIFQATKPLILKEARESKRLLEISRAISRSLI